MEQINFKGNYISTVNVLKKNAQKQFVPHRVSLVEIDTQNLGDILALREIENRWDEPLARDIYIKASRLHIKDTPNEMDRLFIITRQRDNFSELNCDDILAEAHIQLSWNQDVIALETLQVDPEQNFWAQENRHFKGIGSAFIDKIKEIFQGKEIHLYSLPSARKFYLKKGFKQVEQGAGGLCYTPPSNSVANNKKYH